MKWYFKHIKNFKYWGKGLKTSFIADLLRNLICMLIPVGLYLWLDDTGLLVYLILMIKYHWMCEKES